MLQESLGEIELGSEAVDMNKPLLRHKLLHDGKSIVFGFSGMNNERFADRDSALNLPPENLALHFRLRVIIMKIQTAFT